MSNVLMYPNAQPTGQSSAYDVGCLSNQCQGRAGLGKIWLKPWDIKYTLWLFNIAMENNPFIDDFPWFTY